MLDRLKNEFGVFPAWGAAHPGAILPQTLRWSRDPVTPFHCDGVFIPLGQSQDALTADILSGSPWKEMSDHNPIVVVWDSGA